jgi:hypothetical protein
MTLALRRGLPDVEAEYMSTASGQVEPVETEPSAGRHRPVPFRQYRGYHASDPPQSIDTTARPAHPQPLHFEDQRFDSLAAGPPLTLNFAKLNNTARGAAGRPPSRQPRVLQRRQTL